MEENEEQTAQPRPFPPEMIADPESHTVAHQIREYLWGKGPIDYPVVSAHMKRELVSKFVRFELEDLPPANFWRVRILFDLYNLREHLELIGRGLDRSESEDGDLVRSLASTVILCEIGEARMKDQASEYYEYMVRHSLAPTNFEGLLTCLGAFGPAVRPDSLSDRMGRTIGELGQREKSDPEAGVERREIEDLASSEFFFISEANKARQRIDSIADSTARFIELLKVYVEATEDGGAEYLDLWVQQQIRRTAENEGRAKVIQLIRDFCSRLSEFGPVDVEFAKIRLINAIEFFEGELTDDEAAFMRENGPKQVDPLRYAPIPTVYEPEEPKEDDTADDEE